ncbi:MAG: hypothetical protein ABIQ51_27745 [Mesorhizobium sp.]
MGDEITVTATIGRILLSGRARVTIPSFDYPFAIYPPQKAKSGDQVALIGHVRRVEGQGSAFAIRLEEGGLVTIERASITAWRSAPA